MGPSGSCDRTGHATSSPARGTANARPSGTTRCDELIHHRMSVGKSNRDAPWRQPPPIPVGKASTASSTCCARLGSGGYRVRGAAFCSRRRAPISLARRAAWWSPSPAATIEPFIRMCHWRAKPSGSAMPAAAARLATKSRMLGEVVAAGAVERMGGFADLEQDVDERAAFEVVAPEPRVEGVEDREQSLAWVVGALLDFMLKPAPWSSAAPGARGRRARARPWTGSAGRGSCGRRPTAR